MESNPVTVRFAKIGMQCAMLEEERALFLSRFFRLHRLLLQQVDLLLSDLGEKVAPVAP
jgi:hypothetical protein